MVLRYDFINIFNRISTPTKEKQVSNRALLSYYNMLTFSHHMIGRQVLHKSLQRFNISAQTAPTTQF